MRTQSTAGGNVHRPFSVYAACPCVFAHVDVCDRARTSETRDHTGHVIKISKQQTPRPNGCWSCRSGASGAQITTRMAGATARSAEGPGALYWCYDTCPGRLAGAEVAVCRHCSAAPVVRRSHHCCCLHYTRHAGQEQPPSPPGPSSPHPWGSGL